MPTPPGGGPGINYVPEDLKLPTGPGVENELVRKITVLQ